MCLLILVCVRHCSLSVSMAVFLHKSNTGKQIVMKPHAWILQNHAQAYRRWTLIHRCWRSSYQKLKKKLIKFSKIENHKSQIIIIMIVMIYSSRHKGNIRRLKINVENTKKIQIMNLWDPWNIKETKPKKLNICSCK